MNGRVNTQARIAIVGAGVAGLASALYLHRLGHDVTIFERFPAARPVGSGLMLQPTGMTVLHDLGLLDAVLSLGQPINGLLGLDARTERKVLEVAYRGGRFGLGIHRAALFQVLFTAVQQYGIAIETGYAISAVKRSAADIALVTGDQQSDAGPFDLVVDAAGARSPLRDAQASDAVPRPFAYGAFWATLELPDRGFANNLLVQHYERASVMIGVMPSGRLPNDVSPKCAFFWSIKTADVEAVKKAGLAAWKARVLDLWPATAPLLDQIRSFSDLAVAEYVHLTLRRPFQPGVIHIGDSAHATSPQLGQGANMALLDARALAHTLANCDALTDVGPAYAHSRRLHVQLFQLASRALTPFYQSDSYAVPWVRDRLVSTIAKIPPTPAILASLIAGTLVDPFKSIGLKEVAWAGLPLSDEAPTTSTGPR